MYFWSQIVMYSSLGTDYLSGSDSILSEADGYLRGHSITMWTRKEGCGVTINSTRGHLTKSSQYVKCPFLSTRGGLGSKLGKIRSTQLLNAPQHGLNRDSDGLFQQGRRQVRKSGGRGAGIIQCLLSRIVEKITDFNFEREEFASIPTKIQLGRREGGAIAPMSHWFRQPCLVEQYAKENTTGKKQSIS